MPPSYRFVFTPPKVRRPLRRVSLEFCGRNEMPSTALEICLLSLARSTMGVSYSVGSYVPLVYSKLYDSCSSSAIC